MRIEEPQFNGVNGAGEGKCSPARRSIWLFGNPDRTLGRMDSALIARLGEHEALRTIPGNERAWLAKHGDHRVHDAGDVLLTPADESQEMIVQLSGRIVVYFGHGAGRRHAATSKAGSITGLLPFSRLKRPPSNVLVEERTELLAIHRSSFPAMIRECPVLVESLVHNMLDRARRFAAADWQDEKLLSLGRLAAGLSHELNNPASAAASSVAHLAAAIHEVGVAACRFGEASLDNRQRDLVIDLIASCRQSLPETGTIVQRLEQEGVISDWLATHACDADLAPVLVDGGITVVVLESLSAALPAGVLPHALQWIAASTSALFIVTDLQRATRRIHDVVSSVRDFTHMDRAAVREPIDIAAGLRNSADVLRIAADAQRIPITIDVPDTLPRVRAVAPDLNQVWLHLISNALDAVGSDGRIDVTARVSGEQVLVSVVDNGHGIPPDIQPRIFDLFFTTKAVGKGVGLGLDIVRRTVSEFGGDVEVDSVPGRTEFRVRLPAIVN